MSQFQETIERCLRETGAPSAQEATAKQLYHSVSRAAMAELMARWKKTENQKRACYLSAEFLTGRLIYSNLMNLGLLEETTRYLEQNGISPAVFEQIEDDALGNGWDGLPPVFWIPRRRRTSRSTATGSVTGTACSSSGLRTASKRNIPTTGRALGIRGASGGKRNPSLSGSPIRQCGQSRMICP